MAIIIEEEKKSSGITGVVGWLVFLVVLAAAAYYVFFATPTIPTLTTTGNLSSLAPIASTTLQPQSIINSAAFQSLHSTIQAPSPQGPVSVGRPNPFVTP